MRAQSAAARGLKTILALALVAGGLVPVARACLSDFYETIHFRSSNVDFGTPPRRASIGWRGENDNRPSTSEMGSSGDNSEIREDDSSQNDAYYHRQGLLLNAARNLEIAGQWQQARLAWQQTARRYGWSGNRRNRVMVLQQFEAIQQPSPALVSALKTYLDGLAADDARKRPDASRAFAQVYADRSAGFLREHALYQQASLAYEWLDYSQALRQYQQLLREFPQTALREAGLIMSARCALLPDTPEGRRLPEGRLALAVLLRDFPHSRFQRAVRGLQARLDTLQGHWTPALNAYFALDDLPSVEILCKKMPLAFRPTCRVRLLAAYLRQFERTNTYRAYEKALVSIDHTRYAMTKEDARQFARVLRREADLPAPYLYYRLYHCNNHRSDLASLAAFADEIAARPAARPLAPKVQARLAEVYYQQRRYAKAALWADRALRATPTPYDRALYVRGAARFKQKRNVSAIADFTTLLTRCPHSPLRRGAREELALLYEAQNERGRALEQYFALGYQADVAFLLDIRMTSDEIKAYLRRPAARQPWRYDNWREEQPSHKTKEPRCTQRDLIAYSLGIRALQEERWREAERWLQQIAPAVRRYFDQGRREWASKPSPDALTAARQLGHLHRAIASAPRGTRRAEAEFRYASYYYSHGTLLLYNGALWQSSRAVNFQMYWSKARATRADEIAVRRHMYRHEVYARVRSLCLDIARRYPASPLAPRSLYRAACSARALASFSGWWRDGENKRHDFWKEASRLMARVAHDYPHDALAAHARKYASVFAQERRDTMMW